VVDSPKVFSFALKESKKLLLFRLIPEKLAQSLPAFKRKGPFLYFCMHLAKVGQSFSDKPGAAR